MLVQCNSLTKRYGSLTALDDCCFGVEPGEVFGLLGPNGAGKTTLIRLLLGFLRPSAGRATIDGLDCYQQSIDVHRRVAYLPGEARMFRRMRARDVIRFFASIRGDGQGDRYFQLARQLDLDVHYRVALMSTGMRQKLALVVTLAADTPVLILDEPTANLDPNVRRIIIELVKEAQRNGRTVLFSSHVLSEIEEACDRVVILRGGKLVHTQVIDQLRSRHLVVARSTEQLPEVPPHLKEQLTVSHNNERLSIETDGDLATMLPWLASLPIREVTIEPSGLRTVYERFHTTGTAADDANQKENQ